MSISQRQHIRFSLDIPAYRYTKYGDRIDTILQQISIGGCFVEWDETIITGEEFRLEIQLPNRNWLPLKCKALYRFENSGIGVKFIDITRFEQDLIADIVETRLESEGLPMQVDPFSPPPGFKEDASSGIMTRDQEREKILEKILSADDVSSEFLS